MATTYLTDTQGAPTDNLKWTWSSWIKRGEMARGSTVGVEYIFTAYVDASNYFNIGFSSTDQLDIYNYVSGSDSGRLVTNRVFSDPAGWYHVVFVYDSANGAAGDRMKLYINGVEETSFATDTNPGSSQACIMNADTRVVELGRRSDAATNFSGVLAHTHFADGQAYAPTVFGETDSTSGIWVPISSPSVTYGNNGYFLKYASGALGTDSSGNSNDFVVSGTMTPTKDNPENNFAVMNLIYSSTNRVGGTYVNANTTYVTTASNYRAACATVGLTAGLWYFEAKQTQKAGTQEIVLGISGDQYTADLSDPAYYLGIKVMEFGMYMGDGDSYNNATGTSYGSASAQDDILGCYIDLTANKLYFAINGTIQNSGTGITITPAAETRSTMWVPAIGGWSGDQQTIEFNFGNGYFGTTAISGAVADAGGEGQFKYNPSTGTFDSASKDFRAICTNNLGTYGG